jgi:hypothetical protein
MPNGVQNISEGEGKGGSRAENKNDNSRLPEIVFVKLPIFSLNGNSNDNR